MPLIAHLARSKSLDQYYTNPEYAREFYNQVIDNLPDTSSAWFLEPSAGTGSFYNLMPADRRIGLDLEPKASGVVTQDFLQWRPGMGTEIPGRLVTVGNPPFGKNASLAVKFFNHAAKFSSAVAFVVPRSFRKASVVNRLDRRFHLIFDIDVPDNAFLFNNAPYNVWCCAQIWVKKETVRAKQKVMSLSDVKHWFRIVEPAAASFAIQRVGGRAGLIRETNFQSYSKSSHYFIQAESPDVLTIFKEIDFTVVKFNTAGNPSISPGELVSLWVEAARAQGIVVGTQPHYNRLFITQ